MAAYGALVSVMQIIDQIKTHPRPPISLDQKQVESLTQLITSLQDFLHGYSHFGYTKEEDLLESRIADAAYAAEDVIESYIVDQILAGSTNRAENISSIEFYQGLHKVIEEMDLINMEVKEKIGVQDQLHITKAVTVTDAGSSRSTFTAPKPTMVGFDDVLHEMLEKITRGRLDRQIISIVGMGGIGKTTLARNIYVHPLVDQHFDVCAWSTISQEHNALEFLRQLLGQVDKAESKNWRNLSEDELVEQLYKLLIGRRYFIVMDDMWSIEAWDRVRSFFPDDNNASRIVITTRLSNLASQFNYSNCLHMEFLDEAASWDLFSKTVFGKEICPLELEDIGKEIAKGCKGLPLSIVVIGGLLSKAERTLENWVFVEEHLSAIVNQEDDERCLQILYMSYNNLPVYIKPCFLYIVIFLDSKIPVSSLVELWVAEGFIKPVHGKSLEEVAEEYVEELVDRNLLLVRRRNYYGKLKVCIIHDLLRDMCFREARKLKFICDLREQSYHDIPHGIKSQRRIQSSVVEYPILLLQSLESASLVRSLMGQFTETLPYNYGLLRVAMCGAYFEEESSEYYEQIFLRLVNLRYIVVDDAGELLLSRIPSSISFLWNLQTLVLFEVDYNCILEIWKMPLLRRVTTYRGSLAAYCLSGDMDGQDEVVLENLQRLSVVSNVKFVEGVLKRIPNIRKLALYYDETSSRGCDFCLHNLQRLHKLQVLDIHYSYTFQKHTLTHSVPELIFPYSLKKLTLFNTKLPWEDMATKIGCLPLLQVLKLKKDSFTGSDEWETFEGQFSSLRFLLIGDCDLEHWITDNTHFPRLEHLVLCNLTVLGEIPSSIGDIPTLGTIELEDCSESVVDSARRMLQEQEELGNEGLQLKVRYWHLFCEEAVYFS